MCSLQRQPRRTQHGRAKISKPPAKRPIRIFCAIATIRESVRFFLRLDFSHLDILPDRRDGRDGRTERDRRLTLNEAAWGTNTDKFASHRYERFYESAFDPYRELPIRLLKIGVRDGSSLKLWTRYFAHHEHIYGLEYGLEKQFRPEKYIDPGDRVTVYNGDQSDRRTLDILLKTSGGNFDIVIDDGSHVPWHVLLSFYVLFPSVKPGGLYVVEDVETSYWNVFNARIYNYLLNDTGVGQSGNVVEFFTDLTNIINGRVQGSPNLMLFSKMEHEISSIQFAENCIIIRKELNSSDRQRPYLNANMIDAQAVDRWRAEKVGQYRAAFPQLSYVEDSHRDYQSTS